MAPLDRRRRLIVNADDFGRSHSINQAVRRGHEEGILTSASLMVSEPGFEEAVEIARRSPGLGVGLHLTLVCGHAAGEPRGLPGLVDDSGRFPDSPLGPAFRYRFAQSLRSQLRAEVTAQLAKFRATGLKLDHLDGHLHLHLHPTVFRLLEEVFAEFGVTHMRLTRDPLWLNLRLASGRWIYRLGHAALFAWLPRRPGAVMRQRGIRHTSAVFGLLQDSHVDERFVMALLSRLPAGDSELYCHPSLDQFQHEMEALISPRVRALASAEGIELIRYRDL
jgi:chitin disaccharide deacetylase